MWAVTMTAAVPPLIYRSEDVGRLVGICTAAVKTFSLVPPPKHSSALDRGRPRRLNRVCSAPLRGLGDSGRSSSGESNTSDLIPPSARFHSYARKIKGIG